MQICEQKNKISSVANWILAHNELVSSSIIFLAVILWFGFWAHIGVDPHHDGILLKPVSDVLSGQMLFRDSFTQYGALTTLLQAFACSIFGVKLMTIRWLTVLFYAGSSVLVWRISHSILRSFYRIIPILCIFMYAPFYFWTFHSWSSVYALFFLLLTCRLLQLGLEKNRPDWFWCLTGAISILGFWCRQPLGLIVPAAMVVILASHWRFFEHWTVTLRRFLLFTGGILAVCGLFWIWLVLNHAFSDFWTQSIEFAFGFVSGRTKELSEIKVDTIAGGSENSIIGKLIWIFFLKESFWGVLSALVTGWALYLCVWGFVKKNLTLAYWQLLPVILLAGISLHQYYPVPCIRHLYWGGFPAFLIFAYTIQSWCSLHPIRWKCIGLTGTVVIVYIAIFWFTNNCLHNNRLFSTIPSIRDISRIESYNKPGFLQGVWMPAWESQAWNDLQSAVQAIPEKQRILPVLNMTPNGLYNLLFPLQKNWSPVYMGWPTSIDSDYNKKQILLLTNGCCIITVETSVEELGNSKLKQIPTQTMQENVEKRIQKSIFKLFKEICPDRKVLEVPEYHVYGSGRFRTTSGYEFGIVITAPTGKTIQKNRDEIDED